MNLPIILYGKRRTIGELMSPALRDKARGQSICALIEAVGHRPFTRIKISYRKCYVYVNEREYDIDKVKKLPKYIGVLNSLAERG